MSTLTDLIFSKNIEEIRKLTTSGELDPDAFDGGRSALALAVAYDYSKVADALISLGADMNLSNPDNLAYTPLIEAVRENSFESVRLLVERGADVEKGDSRNGTALLHACIAAHQDILEYLHSNGANIDSLDVLKQKTPSKAITRWRAIPVVDPRLDLGETFIVVQRPCIE